MVVARLRPSYHDIDASRGKAGRGKDSALASSTGQDKAFGKRKGQNSRYRILFVNSIIYQTRSLQFGTSCCGLLSRSCVD